MKRAVIFLCFALCGCWTIAPKPTQPSEITFSGGVQNAGIIGYDPNGLVVNAEWLRQLDAMRSDYGSKLGASERRHPGDRKGIRKLSDGNYHVDFQVNDEYADLKYWERRLNP